jgi:hypothetical protein
MKKKKRKENIKQPADTKEININYMMLKETQPFGWLNCHSK